MNKSPAIFQEIESKLAKDHYASQLPVYHPAKGRRKRTVKEPTAVYQNKTNSVDNGTATPESAIGFTDFSEEKPKTPFPNTPPEIEEPGETQIPSPREREIDPDRDFPPPNIPSPDEEEIPGAPPLPEIDPDRLGDI